MQLQLQLTKQSISLFGSLLFSLVPPFLPLPAGQIPHKNCIFPPQLRYGVYASIFWPSRNYPATDMPRQSYRELIVRSHLISMSVRTIFAPPMENIEEQAALLVANLMIDLMILCKLQKTRYLLPCMSVPKHGNLKLVHEYAKNPLFQDCFELMLRVSPYVYEVLISLFSDHATFQNCSHNPQAPVWIQLAICKRRPPSRCHAGQDPEP